MTTYYLASSYKFTALTEAAKLSDTGIETSPFFSFLTELPYSPFSEIANPTVNFLADNPYIGFVIDSGEPEVLVENSYNVTRHWPVGLFDVVDQFFPLFYSSPISDFFTYDPYGGASVSYINRVLDSVAGNYVSWITTDPDTTGASYPGPGVWGVNTSNHVVMSLVYSF